MSDPIPLTRKSVLPPGKQKLRLWLRMLRATRRVEAELRERLRTTFGETLPRFDVLAALHKAEGGISLTQLSRMLMVSNGNVTGIIDRLVQDGSVLRLSAVNDRRTTLVTLTADGAQRFAEMAAAHEIWVSELLDAAGPEETAILIDHLGPLAPKSPKGTM